MAITTVDGALAGMQYPQEIMKAVTGTLVAGRPHSLFYLAGIPAPAVAPAMGLSGKTLTTYSGQIPFTNPTTGKNTYLARLQGQATQAGTLILADRIWHNSGIVITSTGEQLFTGAENILRDANGLGLGTGVLAAVEVTTVTGAGTPTLTLKYVNQAGVTGHTATNVIATVAASIAGTFYPIGLQAGDTGIQKVQSLTLNGTWTSGAISVVLYRIIARLELTTANVPNAIDALTAGFPRLYDNSVPMLIFVPNTTTTSNISAQVIYTQG